MVNIPEEELAVLDQDAKEILAEMEQEQNPLEEDAPQESEVKVEEQKEEKVIQPEEKEKPPEIKTEVSRTVPLAKYQDKKKRWEEEKAELIRERDELKSKVNQMPQEQDESKLDEIAEKWKLDKDLVKDLSKAFSKSSLPDDVLKEINELREEKKLREQKEQIEEAYEDELNDLQKNFKDIDFDNVDTKKLKELAFSERYAKTDLETIFKANKDDLLKPQGKKTFEPSGHDSVPDRKDVSKFTDADIPNMTEEEFDAYMEAKAGKGGLLRR